MALKRMDNVGIVVESLDAAISFFAELGLELEGRAMVEGEWAGRVTGLGDQRVEIAMMRTPDGHVVEQSGRDRWQRTANWCLSGPAPSRKPRCSSGLQQLFNGDRQRSDASAGRVVHGVGD